MPAHNNGAATHSGIQIMRRRRQPADLWCRRDGKLFIAHQISHASWFVSYSDCGDLDYLGYQVVGYWFAFYTKPHGIFDQYGFIAPFFCG
jgi:hypothetical protein